MYIDSHTHFAHRRFDKIRDGLLTELHSQGLEMAIEAAITVESNRQMQKSLEPYPWIYYAVGLHPTSVVAEADKDVQWESNIREALEHPKAIAVGETGLDFHRLSWETESDIELSNKLIERQKYWFHKLIELALEKELPLVIHTRGAHEETLEILRQYTWGKNPGVIHCFYAADALEMAKAYTDMGFVLGIGGKVSYEEELATKEALKDIPMEHIILETDCPFLLPITCEERPNHSGNIPVIAEIVAGQKGMTAQEVMELTKQRTKEVFGLR